jgi:nitroreductase
MNEVLKAIAQRYSCRDFADTPLTDAQLHALADAALQSPSAMNLQPWRVIVVSDKALIDELDAEAMGILRGQDPAGYERIQARGGRMFYNAPCMIIATTDGKELSAMDCGILSQNVTLAAHSLGLGSVICGMAGIPFAGPRGAEFKRRLQFQDGASFGIAVLAGTALSGKAPHEPDRRKLTFIAQR